jgi:hypothetical protein
MSGAIPPLPNMPSWRGAQLKHRDNFTFYLYYHRYYLVIVLGIVLSEIMYKV